MKKAYKLLTAVLMCALLAGCCLSHEWQEATCTAPRTCVKCEETEGEALGHSWEEATCTTSKTCTVCGGTEGEALGHGNLTEANYQEPAHCSVCKEAVGDPLVPDFVKYDVKGQFADEMRKVEEYYTGDVKFWDDPYKYVTICRDKTSEKTVGEVRAIWYATVPPDEEHPQKEGYEWKQLVIEFSFSDENALKYGYETEPCFEDYYGIIAHDESSVWSEDGGSIFTCNWHGVDYTECSMKYEIENDGWHYTSYRDGSVIQEATLRYYFDYLLPVGYDGAIVGFYDASKTWEDGMHIFDVADENTLFFRLT